MSRYHPDYDMTPSQLAKITGASIRTCQNWVHGQPIHQAYQRLLDLYLAHKVMPAKSWKNMHCDIEQELIWTNGIGGEMITFKEMAVFWMTRKKVWELEHQVKNLKRQLENFQNHAQTEAAHDTQTPSHAVTKTTAHKKRA